MVCVLDSTARHLDRPALVDVRVDPGVVRGGGYDSRRFRIQDDDVSIGAFQNGPLARVQVEYLGAACKRHSTTNIVSSHDILVQYDTVQRCTV